MTDTDYGCYALVAYLPQPLSGFLSALQSRLSICRLPEPHITVLPPRPLMQPLRDISSELNALVAKASSFEIELGDVCLFPETNVLYLNLRDGYQEIDNLHAHIAGRQRHRTREEHDFRPHLTLAGPLRDDEIMPAKKAAEIAWAEAEAPRRFHVEELHLLWLTPNGQKKDWKRIWTERLRLRNEANPA